ncbi:DNA repair protein RecN [Thermoflexibacter ruber]|uniref:DNA repair protein RecN n=1 Tax=Thermoflexibacter ruber TaxID=1003 RepID=A0A1I2EKE7_9BACT|nr:DNA repair protein RecN [Thermoflexibacter ruber]SFE92976.1 DNA replication and repair protein RecN [Thermoflexibacter ruber]
MLTRLFIKNYALIKELEINPSAKLNIITGETGAGKSIMLGAIGLLLGNRADVRVLFDEEEKCVIEGDFQIGAYKLQSVFKEADLDFSEECSIRREISPNGKSRAFINDTPVNLEVLELVTSRLMDIHSQHDTLQLGSNEFQLAIVDNYAQNQNYRETYYQAYQAYTKAESAYKKLLAEAEQARKEQDYNVFLLEELNKIKLDLINQTELEQELEVLENAEAIKTKLNLVLSFLTNDEQGAESILRSALVELRQLENYAPRFQQLSERANSLFIELKDIIGEIEREEEKTFLDEERIVQIKETLNLIYSLQKKHYKTSVEELIGLRNELTEKVNRVLNLDEDIEKLRQQKDQAYQTLLEIAEILSSSRKEVIEKIEQEVDNLLKELGMPNAHLSIQLADTAPQPSGANQVSFLFSANKGVKPDTLKNVASGGEFSRLMLCIKYILAGKTALPTIIFDEIDTGISGEIAIKVSKMMKEMAKRHQLIVISHLPQTAANGDCHYFVYKDDSSERAISKIKKLNEQERLVEIAQMIGGANPSPTALQSAKELLSLY